MISIGRNPKQARVEEVIPAGVTNNRPRRSHATPRVYGVEAGAPHTSTFAVVPRHEKLSGKEGHEKLSGKEGVVFNVETVPEALKKHAQMPPAHRENLVESLKETVASHYNDERSDGNRRPWETNPGAVQARDMRLEALSETENLNIVHVGSNGFIVAIVTAFAQHLPLTLSPDDVWIVISYAFAKHVDKNAKALRKNFVQHEGKKRLFVDTPADFAMSHGNNPDTGATAEEWETFVFPEFSSQIKEHIGSKTHEAIAARFSTTTAGAMAAHEVTLMSALKNYFSYGFRTKCGIPNITLLGTEQDWSSLRSRAEHLGSLMMPEFSNYWMPLLLPILDEFLESYKGNVNHSFWQSMVKLRSTGGGSGSHSFISGWIQILFPYLAHGNLTDGLKPWHEMYFQGPELSAFPLLCSSAPVDWEYYGNTFDISFHAGVLGFTQDKATGSLSPLLGWYVSHVPPKPPHLDLKDCKKELNDLLLGHKEEASASEVNKNAPWYRRVQFLKTKVEKLESEVASASQAQG